MNIFIGSSEEAKSDVKQIALIIEDLGHKPIPWYNPGVFAVNKYTMENLEELQDKVDAAIFVFNEDDKTWYRDDIFSTVRDNVLLEYGMFGGALSRSNVCFCCRGNPKIASDLKGITYISLEKQQRSQVEIEGWIKKLKRPLKEINSTRVESFYDAINYAQKNYEIETLRVFAISTSRFVSILRANPKLHVKKAEIMLRKFYNKEKYTDSEMKKLIDIALISWGRLKSGGNIDELSIFRFDYHPDSGYYIFDNSLLIFGNLYYDKFNHHYEFENNVLMIDNTTSVGQEIIDLFIKKFDKEKRNYEN